MAADVPPPFSLRSDNIVATLPVRILIGGSGNRKVALSERNYVTRAHDHNLRANQTKCKKELLMCTYLAYKTESTILDQKLQAMRG